MTPATKILIGALATAALALVFHGPMGFGKSCTAETVAATRAAAARASANANAVASCQESVDAAIAGKAVRFVGRGAEIAPESKELLIGIGASLKGCGAATVEVAGFTDRAGDAESNQALSQARADAVKAALVASGVPAGRLVAKGYGETGSTDPNAPEDNPADRRIEFSVAAAAAPVAN